MSMGDRNPEPWVFVAVALWVSFMSAAVATLLFFATFDPEQLLLIATYPLEMSRTAGYSIGFLGAPKA